jgi:5-methyltetrahydrofolate--homocysteine methyltransferase
MSEFLKSLRAGKTLLMDGAMGTELQRAGATQAECFELWNLTRAEQVRAIHHSYVDAGAMILLTNTFQANPESLGKYGAGDRLGDIFHAAIDNARSVAGPDRFVLADVGPMAKVDAATASLIVNAAKSADAMLLETWSDPSSVEFFSDAAAAQTRHHLPLLVSFTFWRPQPGADLCTFAGFSPEACAGSAQRIAAAALGVNCGRALAHSDFLEIIQRYCAVTDVPVFARPNAGTPARVGESWAYPKTPGDIAASLPALLQAGACMIGGCCGTTPEYISAFHWVIEEWNSKR